MLIGWIQAQAGAGGADGGGFQRSALKPLLWGEPPAFGGVGGTLPPRLSPGGGNGKGGVQIPCCRRQLPARHAMSPGFPSRSASPYSHSEAGIPSFFRARR